MNDHDLLTIVRDSFGAVRADTPLTAIEARGRRARARRRRGLAGASALAAGAAAVAVTASLAPPAAPAGSAELTAWTVTEKPGGQVTITIRELKNPAGLQRTLRADGIPAIVRFGDDVGPTPGCQRYPDANHVTPPVVRAPAPVRFPDRTLFVIDGAAIPRNALLSIVVAEHPGIATPHPSPPPGTHLAQAVFAVGFSLVRATPTCS